MCNNYHVSHRHVWDTLRAVMSGKSREISEAIVKEMVCTFCICIGRLMTLLLCLCTFKGEHQGSRVMIKGALQQKSLPKVIFGEFLQY